MGRESTMQGKQDVASGGEVQSASRSVTRLFPTKGWRIPK